MNLIIVSVWAAIATIIAAAFYGQLVLERRAAFLRCLLADQQGYESGLYEGFELGYDVGKADGSITVYTITAYFVAEKREAVPEEKPAKKIAVRRKGGTK